MGECGGDGDTAVYIDALQQDKGPKKGALRRKMSHTGRKQTWSGSICANGH